MNDVALRYRAEILRAVFGSYANEGKVNDLHRLNQIAEHLAECEEAQSILRAKGYGRSGHTFVEAVRSVPNNLRQILKNIFAEPEQQRAAIRYSPEEIAQFYGIPNGDEHNL